MRFLDWVHETFGPYAKGVAGYVAPIVVGFALKYGVDLDVDTVVILITSLITGSSVVAKRNT